jgi:hypothetical protein
MATAARAEVVISEFMASNVATLADEDGEYPDWIELHNTGTAPVDLDNWSLTDLASALTQWRFPATNLPPDGYLVVFASGKDRRHAGAPLHTNFKLSAAGEYLGLVMPDGKTVASEYAPTFPAQVDGVSCGLDPGLRPLTLLSTNAAGRLWVPADDSLGLSWTLPGFDDSGWRTAVSPVGYSIPSLDHLPVPGLMANLAGYWKFDEASGFGFADASGLGGDGTIVGLALSVNPWTNGVDGGALRLRGAATRGVARVPNYAKATAAVSCAAWIWADARTTWATIARNWGSTGGQFQFGLRDTAGDLAVQVNTTGGQFEAREGVALATGQWHHVAFTADGVTLRLFRDGLLVASTPCTGTFTNPPSAPLGIGGRLNDAGTAPDSSISGIWNGRLDEVGVWNRAVGAEELGAMYEAGLGLGASVRTDLRADMLGRSATAYLRFPFQVDDLAALVNPRMTLRYDDGVAIWLNGQPLVQRNASDSPTAFSTALAPRPQDESREPELLNLSGYSDLFVQGTNWLAVQVLNASAADNDLMLELLLEAASTTETTNQVAYFTTPTPGGANTVGVKTLGPIISRVSHAPQAPATNQDLWVTARVSPTFAPVGGVTLKYRVAYSNEVSVAMADDGDHGDGASGDGVYGAAIPAGTAPAGFMIRYAIVATDTTGRTNRLPLFPDRLNSAEYFGTAVVNPAVKTALPVIQWFVRSPAAAEGDPGTQASILYNGEFYDNVYVRIRGGTSRGWPKHSYKVELPPDHEFLIHPGVGRVTEFDLNTTYTDKSYVRAVLHSDLQLDSGMMSPETFHVRLEQNGKFYSVALWTEQPDKAFLRRYGLDEHGALYKAGPGSFYEPGDEVALEKKTRLTEDKSDAKALIKSLQLKGAPLENFVFDSIDLPAQLEYMATTAVAQNIDASDKNHFLYRDTEGSGEWRMLPWDLDLSFGPNALNTDFMVYNENYTSHPFIGANPYVLSAGKHNMLLEAVVNTPRTREMLLRRIRTLVDQYLARGYFESKIDQLAVLLGPDVSLDQAKWKADGFFPGNSYTLQQALDRIKNEYLTPRLPYLRSLTLPGITNSNPGAQPYAPFITFGERLITPPSGNQDEEYVQLVNTNAFPVDVSGWSVSGDVSHLLKPGTVIPSGGVLYLSPKVRVFRARATSPRGGEGRFVQGNYQGHLNARGGALSLRTDWGYEVSRTAYVGSPSPVQQYLQVSEVMYHPPALPGDPFKPDEYEFVEVWNSSPGMMLNLTGVRFDRGILFDFTGSPFISLSPGQRVVVVKNRAAFQARYGTSLPVAGEYLGALNNGSEGLRLVDSLGEGVADFQYSPDWYPITDGLGFSLSLASESAGALPPSGRESWRVSTRVLGTPGLPEPGHAAIPSILVNEALTASATAGAPDVIELFNPTGASVPLTDWYLTDDFRTPGKYRIPAGKVIPARGHLLFTSHDFGSGAGAFQLGQEGDEVWLFSGDASGALTGYVHGFRFGAIDAGITFGRHVDSTGREHFVPQAVPSLGTANSGPRVGPLVLSEIGYHPAAVWGPEPGLEFIELHNEGIEPLGLEVAGAPDPAWRLDGAVRFAFPTNLVVPAGGSIVVTGFDPVADPAALARLRTVYTMDPGTPVIGPWDGALSNAGERLRLLRPLAGGGPNPVWVTVDEVGYSDAAPWPDADGDGASLSRAGTGLFGNDPASWVAALPSPGRVFLPGTSPAFTVQPSNARGVAFQDLQLKCEATGAAPLRFQWRFEGSVIEGATNPVLSLPRIAPWQAGTYRVTVFNPFGAAVSSNAVVAADLPPFLMQQPAGRLVKQGSNVVFSVVAVGTGPVRYQWRRNGQVIPSADQATFSIPSARPSDSGTYDVVVTDAIGPAVSDPAVLIVSVPPVITAQPDDTVVLVGQTLRLLGGADGTAPIGFRWRRASSTVNGQTNLLMVITNAQTGHAGAYTLIITNFAGSVTSRVATVTVLADVDRDGMADVWETAHGFDPSVPGDALADADGDGVSNRDEYLAGTDPRDASSFLRFLSVRPVSTDTGAGIAMSFMAASNHTYAILNAGGVPGGQGTTWSNRWTFPALPVDTLVSVTNRLLTDQIELYRLQTPRLP